MPVGIVGSPPKRNLLDKDNRMMTFQSIQELCKLLKGCSEIDFQPDLVDQWTVTHSRIAVLFMIFT